MKYKALVVDFTAINFLMSVEGISPEWFNDFAINSGDGLVRSRIIGDVAFVLSQGADKSSRVAVIQLERFSLTDDADLVVEAFRRVFRGCLRLFDPGISIPKDWRPYHKGGRYISFQSNSLGSGVSSRAYIETNPPRRGWVNVYYLGAADGTIEENPTFTRDLFRHAAALYEDALVAPSSQTPEQSGSTYALTINEEMRKNASTGLSYDEWLSRLTLEQMQFVSADEERSAKLIGPAGSGKTLAMVMKFIKLAKHQAEESESLRVCFITQSQVTADLVRSMLWGMAPELIDQRNPDGSEKILITTLIGLANNSLALDIKRVELVDHDAIKGRQAQLELIQESINEFRADDWRLYKDDCSEIFRTYIENEKGSDYAKFFACEVMNEIACVLDADSVRDNVVKKNAYLKAARKKWMMHLQSQAEREVLLNIYRRFRDKLREYNYLSIDQVVQDYLGYLDGYEWDRLKDREGFDFIFVDEFHLFNRVEQLALPLLMRGSRGHEHPVIFMAYDAMQSPRDTFLPNSNNFDLWRIMGISGSSKYELTEIFRYTPQIFKVLNELDSKFATIDLTDEWPAYQGFTKTADGDLPEYFEASDFRDAYDKAFGLAKTMMGDYQKGRDVAVLCCNPDLFQLYIDRPKYKENYVLVSSRDDITKISSYRKRFVLSMPEFVAGLQFKAVILVDVNDDAVIEGPGSSGAMRRYISQLYLGASRAEQKLIIFASRDRGGLTRYLRGAIPDVIRAAT